MIDIHCHLIPGVDDGSSGMHQSLEMAVMAVESGVDTLICTPHANQMGRFENFIDSSDLRERFRHLKMVVQQEGIPLDLYLGQEILCSADMGRKIRNRQLISLNHSGYYLVEFSFDEMPEYMEKGLITIFENGGIPILAHPERFYCVQDQPDLLYRWMKMGALAQVNKGSIQGRFGGACYDTAMTLLDHGLVSCVASDAHSPYMRTTNMAEARILLEERFGSDVAHRLTMSNPERIITGRQVPFRGRKIYEDS